MLYFSRIQYKETGFLLYNRNMSWCSSCIYICGAARNCEPYLDAVFSNITRITELFADFHIIIAFDVSEDETLSKLMQYKEKFEGKMDVLVNHNPLSSRRTENISNARNSILNKIRERESPSEYFIMMDMDSACSGPMNLDVFKRAMERSDKWDSVSFNRYGYYDLWALSIDKYIYSCEGWHVHWQVVEHMREYIVDKLSKIPADEFAECRSAFNGFAVYRTAKFLDCHYDWHMPKQYMKLEELLEQQRILWGVGSKSPLDQNTDEPDCEHRAFHMMAEAKNGARIRISPETLF